MANLQRADRAAARFVPRLKGGGTPQRGVRYRFQQLRDAPIRPGSWRLTVDR